MRGQAEHKLYASYLSNVFFEFAQRPDVATNVKIRMMEELIMVNRIYVDKHEFYIKRIQEWQNYLERLKMEINLGRSG